LRVALAAVNVAGGFLVTQRMLEMFRKKTEMKRPNQITLWYLLPSVCFILALKGLSSPTTARRGNAFGIAGMTIAVVTTIAVIARGRSICADAMLAGGAIGAFVATARADDADAELVAACTRGRDGGRPDRHGRGHNPASFGVRA